MANVRIGPDGSIIKDDVVVETDGRTIIREDGTIETTNLGRNSASSGSSQPFNAPPVSPLERNGNRSVTANTQTSNSSAPSTGSGSQQRGSIDLKAIKEKEYDIQMIDGRIRNAIPKSMIIATIILLILGADGMYFFFIPAVVTGYMVIAGFSNKSQLEAERAQMYEELQAMQRGERR